MPADVHHVTLSAAVGWMGGRGGGRDGGRGRHGRGPVRHVPRRLPVGGVTAGEGHAPPGQRADPGWEHRCHGNAANSEI